ncbi:MAG TPA: hypothetical protein VJ769_00190 [Actinomycetes bacterium]|nr:hypothetical protein [Actinomycetes bacterium]
MTPLGAELHLAEACLASAVAQQALDGATAMGAHALVRHLTQAEGVGR